MWIFTRNGFLSVVQHKSKQGYFQVKSREIDPLELLWPEHTVEIIDWADYRFRITMKKEDFLPIILEQVEDINYTSFKNECWKNHDYHDALVKVWMTMYQFQQKYEISGKPT